MKTSKVKIVKHKEQYGGMVFIDGMEVHGVINVSVEFDYKKGNGYLPIVKLELWADELTFLEVESDKDD